MEPTAPSAARPSRVLVLANEACAGETLFAEIDRLAGQNGEVLLVAPAAVGRLDYWTDDDDVGRHRAATRLEESFAACATAGIRVHGEIGDADALQALDDAIATFGPDAVVIATHHFAAANWLERDVVSGARARHPELEIHHAVVEPAAGRALLDDAVDEPGWQVRRPRGTGDQVLFWGSMWLAIFGSLLWVLGGLVADLPEGALISWAIVVDLGFKALFGAVVVWRFLLRPRSDRDER